MKKETESHPVGCIDCGRKIPFKLPKEIFNACKNGNLVVFAGAGVSTESRNVFSFSLYDDVYGDLKEESKIKQNDNLSFPGLMTRYAQTITNGRRQLLNKIKSRIDYTKSFPELYRRATIFHQELSTIHQIKEIITTNWDAFFEEECGAIPIVTPDDFIFWDHPDRKVFKLHGSIDSIGSIVVTEQDYKRCYGRLNKGIMGASTKVLWALN